MRFDCTYVAWFRDAKLDGIVGLRVPFVPLSCAFLGNWRISQKWGGSRGDEICDKEFSARGAGDEVVNALRVYESLPSSVRVRGARAVMGLAQGQRPLLDKHNRRARMLMPAGVAVGGERCLDHGEVGGIFCLDR